MSEAGLLLSLLREPRSATALSGAQWDVVIRQARRADLLARLGHLLDEADVTDGIPEPVRRHLESWQTLAKNHAESVRWEVDRIRAALSPIGLPVVLLKGAAYVAADILALRGRLFYDVDILVPEARIADAERALVANGWVLTHLEAYDQRYYRQWMHEIPPLRHVGRKTVLDVHHNILPRTARLKPDGAKLLADARPVAGNPGIQTLSPADMVLHSATHLFHDGELEHGLRDLVDLDGLIRHFATDPKFWSEISARATDLDLRRPLYYALSNAASFLDTPVPEQVMGIARQVRPRGGMDVVMAALFGRGLLPDHATCRPQFSGLARWLLYVRSHYLRMPFHLLIPHLFRKAWRHRFQD